MAPKTILLSLLAASVVFVSGSQAQPLRTTGAGGAAQPGAVRVVSAESVPGELIVRFKPAVGSQARTALLQRFGASVGRNLGLPDLVLVRLAAGELIGTAAATFARDPQILYAEPNYYRRISAPPNDTRFGELVGLHNTGQLVNGFAGAPDADIDAPEAWDIETGDPNVVVAVIDTGGAFDHPDLAANVWSNPGENGATASEGPAPNCTSRGLALNKSCNNLDDDTNDYVDDGRGWDWVGGDPSPRDLNGHGTHVGGTIGGVGNNASGVVGVSWEVRLMFLRVFDATGSGSAADIISAFNYAGARGARVVNGSFGGVPFSTAEQDAINAWPNTLFVFAAGNDGTNNDTTPVYPCSYTSANIVCVAATDPNDAKAGFSNFGATHVDLGAPGVNTLSVQPAFAQLWSDDFEAAGTWTTGGVNNTWARTTQVAAPSPTNSLTDSPGGSYLNDTNSWAQRASAFSLTGQSDCMLDYALRLATESGFDVLWIETSIDAGASWSTQSGWTGSTGDSFFSFRDEFFGVGGAASGLVRYRLETDGSISDNGAHIDNASVKCLSSTFGPSNFTFFEGTSMASPHVAGAAALVIARSLALGVSPPITTAQVKTILLASVDPLPSLAGATVTGGRLNLFKAVSSLTTVPGAPTSVAATAGNASAGVSWTAPGSNGGSAITNYVVTPYIGAVAQPATTVGNVTSTTISGLTNGTTYAFRVATTNAVGTGPQSTASNAVSPTNAVTPAPASGGGDPPKLTRAGGPFQPPLRARRSGRQAIVSVRISVNEAARLKVSASSSETKKPLLLLKGSQVGSAVAQANRTAIGYTLTGAQAVTLRLRLPAGLVKRGKVYSIRIVATDPGGESATLLIRFRG